MRVEILVDNIAGHSRGDIAVLPESVNVRALVKSGAVKLAPEPKPTKKAAKKAAVKKGDT